MEQAKLFSMTAVLTLLIWATADSLVNDTRAVRVALETYPRSNPDLLMEIAPPKENIFVQLQVVGPRKAVEEISAREDLRLRLPVDDRSPGPGELALDKDLLNREIRNQWREFERLTVITADPPTVPLVVDRWVSQSFDVAVSRLELTYDQPPQLNRTTVDVRLRESSLARLLSEAGRPLIDLSEEIERQLRNRPAGERAEFRVSIDVSRFGPGAVVQPAGIEGAAVVAAQRLVEEIPTVPIKLVVSFDGLKRALQPVGRDGTPINLVAQTIRVAGPADEVLRLKRGETRAFGLIQLKEAELDQPGDIRAWTPEFVLPGSLQLADPPPPVEFRMMPVTGVNAG